MTHFHTCRTCATDTKTCPVRATLNAAIFGLGVGSLKHKCTAHVPTFTPGAAVLVKTVAWMGSHPRSSEEWEDDPPIYWFRGHFIRYGRGSSLVVFVRPGTIPQDGPEDHAFEPRGSGFIKAPLYRVEPSDWTAPVCIDECTNCGAITSLGQPCARDVNYHPPAKCQAHPSAAPAPFEPTDEPHPNYVSPETEDEWVF